MKYWSLLVTVFITSSVALAQKSQLINSRELIEHGTQLHDSGEYKKAIAIYDQIDRNDTNYAWSVYEKALSCSADSQYNEAIKYCEEGLSLHSDNDHEAELYNQYGSVLNAVGQSEKSLTIFDSAIVKYPSFSLLYFNKGITYVTMDRYKEAEELFKQTLIINPYMYSAHFYLGISALHQGKIVQAYLSFIGYLLITPEGKYSSKAIKLLDEIANAKDEILEYKNKRTEAPDDNYGLVEEVVLAKIALEKEYKPLLSLDDAIPRQIQVIFEKLERKDEDNDFWSQYYLPFYKKVFNENRFEFFVNWIFENVKIKPIQDFNRKNKKEMEAFVNEVSAYFNLIRSTRQLKFSKRQGETNRYLFDQGKLLGKGKVSVDGKFLTGPWTFYFPEGNLSATGQFTNDGKRDGFWTYYYHDGALKASENYKNGKLDGEAIKYYKNGLQSSHQFFVQDQNEGNYTSYYQNGAPYMSVNYKNGKAEGEKKEFYNNGSISRISHFAGSRLEGPSILYYKNGSIKEKSNYQKDALEGSYQSLNENGTVAAEGSFVKGKGEGEWKYYYESGKLKSKCVYKGDKREGNFEEFYETGELKAIYPYEKGTLNGECIYYDKDQRIFGKLVYARDVLQSAGYFDKLGKQIGFARRNNDLISLDAYNAEGYKTSHLNYDAKGNLTGLCTYYYPSGKISQTEEYRDGKINGSSISYYRNGQKKSEVTMVDGKEDGYYTGYFLNGQKQSEGWYRNAEAEGHWISYDELGNVTTKTYYIDGEIGGYKEEFSPNGKKTFEGHYSNGWLESLTQYDTSGQILVVNRFPRGSGKYTLLYPNGNRMVESHFVYGDFDGAYTSYYFDGTIESVQFFRSGLQDSIYHSYSYGGKTNTIGHFDKGKKTGEWKYFDEDGNLSNQAVYNFDMIDGLSTYYFENGKKDIEIHYKDDHRHGSTVRLDPDGSVAYAVRYDEDVPKAYNYQDTKGNFVPEILIPSDSCQFKTYFPNGKMARQCTYVDDKLSGLDILYYPNGQVRYRDSTVFGIDEGPRMEYFPNGKIRKDYFYLHDNNHGICREFSENGIIQKEFAYWNGALHGTTKYFKTNGQLKQTRHYYYGKLLFVKNEN
ncbi:MAG: hypothetical protein C5B59_20235 [Bacteroidetes bacterium]|nr:MAG: hypothetical protein C5B59_20235 [Bacteroidota bacterium]